MPHSTQSNDSSRRRLAVCCDGTYTGSDTGKETNPSNIALLSRTISRVGVAKDGSDNEVPQIVYYQSGIGTGAMSLATKGVQVCEAYNFLANNYTPGDEIFLFGFSRGAYTARCLAGFICHLGLLTPGMMDYFDDIYNAYKKRGDVEAFEDTAWAKAPAVPGELGLDPMMYPGETFTRAEWIRKWAHLDIEIKAIGVFDTVGSLGMSGWVDQPGTDVGYHSTTLHPKIRHAFQALALDESRGNFPPTLFYLDEECRRARVDLRQCWFPGHHGDIGGDAMAFMDTNSMNEITFAWMVDQLEREGLLQFDEHALQYPILDRLTKLDANTATSLPPLTPEAVNSRRIQWSDGTLVQTDNFFWKVASMLSNWRPSYHREPGVYYAKDGNSQVDYEHFNEEIHPSVYHRMLSRSGWFGYKPESLRGWKRVEDGPGKGFSWVKEDGQSSLIGWLKGGEKEAIRLKEYQIPVLEKEEMNEYGHWSGSLERVLAPKDYLVYLDEAWEV